MTEFAVYRNLQFPVFAVIFTYVYEAYQTNVHKTAGNYSLPVFAVTQFAVSTVYTIDDIPYLPGSQV